LKNREKGRKEEEKERDREPIIFVILFSDSQSEKIIDASAI